MDTPPQQSPIQRRYFALGVLVLSALAFWLYRPAFDYPMIFDDVASILENNSVHHLWPLIGESGEYGPLKPKPGQPFTARPLVNLSIAIDYHFGGENPRVYRIVNLVMHIITSVLLAAIVIATLRLHDSSERLSRHRYWLGFASAAVWMMHPIHTETVIYLTQRTELMMGMFYLLTLFLCIKYWCSTRMAERSFFLMMATLAGIAGMLCKEMMASIPAMAFLYERTFIRPSLRNIVKQSWPLYVGLMLSWLLIAGLYAVGYGTPAAGFNNTISAVDYWMTEAGVFFTYWRLTFWPWPLVINYQVPTVTSLANAWPAVAAMILYVGVTTWLVWRRSVLGYGLIWFVAVLSPTLVIPLPREELVERRLYVPLAAIAPLVVIGVYSLITYLVREGRKSYWLTQGIVTALVAVLCFVSFKAIPRLSDRMTVWLHVLEHDSDNPLGLMYQGILEYNAGQEELGLRRLEAAFETRPDFKPCVLVLAKAYKERQRPADEINVYRTALEVAPNDPTYHYNLGLAFDLNRKPLLAMKHYEENIRLDPTAHYAHHNLGMILAERGNFDSAIKHFEAAVDIEPSYDYCLNLMTRYLALRQYEDAGRAAKKLLAAARKDGRTDEIEIIERTIVTLQKQAAIPGD
ncbi:lipoprotein NlpI [Rubripirellula amarantea]|uniref:Lipoprotein NlpI n=1 Tax=Rubripirellula amarantea TaxID=2527999 RepID=A0A5C5WTG0_9BACT|nr:tetratricopeptide repeat protein [Rubripirellula amarantea]TWT53441.1 lipoprotein NlpI [Rubripirellula amarantea]